MKRLALGAIFAVTVTGFTGCATHIAEITDTFEKLPGKEHKPNPAMAGIGKASWRVPLYYPNESQTR